MSVIEVDVDHAAPTSKIDRRELGLRFLPAWIRIGTWWRRKVLMISATQNGGLTMEENSVRYLAESVGRYNRQVVSLRCRLKVRGKRSATPASIVISCYPRVAFGTDVREIRDDLQGRVKEEVEKLTGLTVLRINVAKVKFERGNTTRLLDG